ncbi:MULTISPECIES: hypothetical protein [unclassified Agarivorans]|uniref:hypothetical protein n=1 Tax=unclassified Agarivorans TaxID=2636026 RepID=UPI003D7C8FB3
MSDTRQSYLPLLTDYYQKLYSLAKASDTPLLADGLDSRDNSAIQWTYPDGTKVPMSNLASQQNFFRGLVALSTITGEACFADQAKQTVDYFLEHYVDQASGLFHWGGHRFIHRDNGNIEGPASKECVHELKHHFPFYDFLYQVAPETTQNFLKGFWSAHVLDWNKLDLSRHGQYLTPCPDDVFQQHQPSAVVDPSKLPALPETVGLTFVNAATDLVYAACHYYKYSGDQDAATWAKHLYHQFVLARHPETGMPVYQYSSPLQREPIPEDDSLTYSWFGDRAKRQFGPEFGDIAREANVLFRDCWPVVVDNPLAILECAKQLNDPQMAAWAVDGIKAYFQYAWDEASNEIIPMWNSGQDMTGFVLPRDGYYGAKGGQIKRHAADPSYLLPLVRASVLSDNSELRALTASMFARFGLGELDAQSLAPIAIAEQSDLSSAYLVFALLELYQISQDSRLLSLADLVGQNLLKQHYHRGYFLASSEHVYARLDDPIPYALLAIEAAYKGLYSAIPVAISKGGYLHGERLVKGEVKTVYDYDVLYSETLDGRSFIPEGLAVN